MLLQKQDEKFLLKFHTSGNTVVVGQGNSGKFCHSPVVKLSTMIYRPVATGSLNSILGSCCGAIINPIVINIQV